MIRQIWVTGWSENHSYFRNKYNTFETLEEAQACIKSLKTDLNWKIPTVIVKLTLRLTKLPEPEFFETAPVNQLGFANTQQVDDHQRNGLSSWLCFALKQSI